MLSDILSNQSSMFWYSVGFLFCFLGFFNQIFLLLGFILFGGFSIALTISDT